MSMSEELHFPLSSRRRPAPDDANANDERWVWVKSSTFHFRLSSTATYCYRRLLPPLPNEMAKKQRNKHYGGDNGLSSVSPTSNYSKLGIRFVFPEHLLRQHRHCDHYAEQTSPESLVETLVPSAVFVARNALSSKECQEWIKYAENDNEWDVVSHPATKWIAHREWDFHLSLSFALVCPFNFQSNRFNSHHMDKIPSVVPLIWYRCGRIQKNDWDMSHRLYQRIENIVRQISPQLDIFDKATTLLSNSEKCSAITKYNNIPQYQPITCNPNLRLYKYTKGQWFGRHVDESNRIDFPSVSSSSKCNNTSKINPAFSNATSVKEAQTEITVLFYLSSCRGGATTFHLPHQRKCSSTSIAFMPEEGAVLLHVHGDRCLEHEAEPVLEGVKYGETIILEYYEYCVVQRSPYRTITLVVIVHPTLNNDPNNCHSMNAQVLRTDIVYGIV